MGRTGYRWLMVILLVVGAAFAAGSATRDDRSVQLSTTDSPEGAGRASPTGSPPAARTGSTARGVVHVSEHLFYVSDGDEHPSFPRSTNDLADPAANGGVVLHAGISAGLVNVAVEVVGAPPTTVALDGWEEVVEVSVTADGRLHLTELFGGEADGFPVLNPQGPGTYRLRVHARGRERNYDGVDFEPNEEYLLVVWPAPTAPEAVHKQTEATRKAAASRPPRAEVPSTEPPPQPVLPQKQPSAQPPPELNVEQRS